MTKISVTNFHLVENHPYVKAVAHMKMEGLYLRGLRLEQREQGELTVGYPGRKVRGQWQGVYEPGNRATESLILEQLKTHYEASGRMAA